MVRAFLFPRYEAEHPEFRAEVERLAVLGLRVIGTICVGAPVFAYLLSALLLSAFPDTAIVLVDASQVSVGAVCLFLSFQRWMPPYARGLGIFIGALVATLQTAGILLASEFHETVLHARPEQHLPIVLSFVLPVGIVALPMKPSHTFGLGAGILSVFFLGTLAARAGVGSTGEELFPVVQSVMLVTIFTLLTAVLYRQRAEAFLARRRAEESFQELSQAQASLLIEKNAASQSRFAATLSHELNTPLGALASAFETLQKLLERFDERLEQDPRRKQVLDDAMSSSHRSFERVNQIAERMRHLTNLDKAELQRVDLNTLCRDVLAFLAPELGGVEVELEMSSVPELECRPQQIGAVLSNLLRNAAAAVDHGGRIVVSSENVGSEVWIKVRDNGRGIAPEELETLFEPAFRVDGGRVATANWGLFVSRSIVTEHGGQLHIDSQPGAGATATMRLPV